MNDELIVLLHNDLDAAGCQLNIEYKMPNIRKKYFYTNYGDLKQKVQEIEDYIKQHGNTHCLMADVSWSTHPNELHIMCSIFEKITLIDHHLYPDGFFDNYPKLKVHWDKSKCATLLCYEYFKNDNQNLLKLSKLIDVYDIWQDKHPAFEISQDLNRFFWEIGMQKFAFDCINSEYSLPYYYKTVVDNITERYTEAINKYENRRLIHRTEKITLVFVDEWFNEILVQEMKAGRDFVINATSFGIIKVRINQTSNINSDMKNKLRLELTGVEDIGHENAFTYKMKKSVSFENIMTEMKSIIQNINNICYKGD